MRPWIVLALQLWLIGPVLAADWYTDYTAARAAASKRNVPLLIKFDTAGCVWCRRQDDELSRMDLSKCVLLKGSPELAGECGVTSYPTMIAANPDGYVKDRLVGFHGAADVQKALDRAKP